MRRQIELLNIQLLVREFETKDYQTLCKWWKDWEKPIIPFESLPKNGLIISDVAALFLYKTDSNIALVENLITNKFYIGKDRDFLVNLLCEEIFTKARSLGFQHIFSSSENQFVVKRLIKHKYKILDNFKLFYKGL